MKFQDKPILRTGQKSALQHSPFWPYASFSKLMRTIHISMTSKFQCEYCQCFTFKRCDKLKLKCTSHGGMYSTHYFGKISINVKTVNVVMQIFDRFVVYVCLKILRCWRTISRPCRIKIPNSLQKPTLKAHFVENVFLCVAPVWAQIWFI